MFEWKWLEPKWLTSREYRQKYDVSFEITRMSIWIEYLRDRLLKSTSRIYIYIYIYISWNRVIEEFQTKWHVDFRSSENMMLARGDRWSNWKIFKKRRYVCKVQRRRDSRSRQLNCREMHVEYYTTEKNSGKPIWIMYTYIGHAKLRKCSQLMTKCWWWMLSMQKKNQTILHFWKVFRWFQEIKIVLHMTTTTVSIVIINHFWEESINYVFDHLPVIYLDKVTISIFTFVSISVWSLIDLDPHLRESLVIVLVFAIVFTMFLCLDHIKSDAKHTATNVILLLRWVWFQIVNKMWSYMNLHNLSELDFYWTEIMSPTKCTCSRSHHTHVDTWQPFLRDDG